MEFIKKSIKNLFLESNFYNEESTIEDSLHENIYNKSHYQNFSSDTGTSKKNAKILYFYNTKYFNIEKINKPYTKNNISITYTNNPKTIYSLSLVIKPTLIILEVVSEKTIKILETLRNNRVLRHIPVITTFKKKYDKNIQLATFSKAIIYMETSSTNQSFKKLIINIIEKQNKSILIVDDDRIIREMIKIYLEKEGYNVILAQNGLEAKELFYKHKPNLIVMDILMPYQDGLSTIKELHKDIYNTYIIILTTKNQHENVINGLKYNVHDYISKPFNLANLIGKINSLLKTDEAKNI